jgi:hypothetical protein
MATIRGKSRAGEGRAYVKTSLDTTADIGEKKAAPERAAK